MFDHFELVRIAAGGLLDRWCLFILATYVRESAPFFVGGRKTGSRWAEQEYQFAWKSHRHLMRLWDIISHIPPAFNFCARPRTPVLHEGVECKVERCNELSPHESCGGKGEGWWGWECSLISCCEAPMIFEEVRMLLYWVVLNLRWVLVVRGFGAWRPDAGRRRWKGGAGLGLAHKLVLYRKVGWQYWKLIIKLSQP